MDAGLRNEHASVILNNVVKLHITRKEEETMTQKKFSTKYLVEMALLVAIILIMALPRSDISEQLVLRSR